MPRRELPDIEGQKQTFTLPIRISHKVFMGLGTHAIATETLSTEATHWRGDPATEQAERVFNIIMSQRQVDTFCPVCKQNIPSEQIIVSKVRYDE